MKKILLYLLILCSISTFAQAEFPEGIQVTNAQDNTALKVNVQNATGVINWKYLADFQKEKAILSTGLLKNGLISANGDPTKFNITAGIGIISNFDDPENPTSTIVNFPAFTGITPTYLLTGTITYVAINSTPAVVMQATPFTPEQRRSLITLGAVIHSNLTTINILNNISAPSNADTNQLHDFIEAVGALNLTGNKYTANGANLQLNKSAGLIFKLGSNFANDWKNPHELAQIAGTSLTFRYRTQNGTEGSDRINLDPSLYDLNNVLTAVPNNKFTIQTVVMFQSGLTRILYGQNIYDDLASAKNAIFTRNFVIESNAKENGIIRAYIIMRNTTTSLQSVADADIQEAQKFGGVASGGVALTLANIVTALGYTPENTANKQNSLTPDGTGTKYATVDAVNAALPTAYSKIVYVNTTNPTTATIFDLNNPPITNDNALKTDVNNLYIGSDASTWVYITSPAGYVTKTVTSSTSNFFLNATTTDAGNNKTAIISRDGDIVINAIRIGRGTGNIISNLAIGASALMSNTTGVGSIAIGSGSLRLNTTGNGNFASGSDALRNNLSGNNNYASGSASLFTNSTSSNNTAISSQALYSNNGSDNVSIGFASMFGNTTGARNTAVGKESGKNVSGGGNATIINNSTFIGYDTRPLADNQTNQLVVGYSGIGLGSNTSVFGNSTTVFGRWWGKLLVGGSANDGINDIQSTGTVSSGTTTLGNTPPTANNQLTRKDYVDTADTLKANLASPTFTGVPSAPTATIGTNTTQIATTAFVKENTDLNAHWTKTGNDITNNNIGKVYFGAAATGTVSGMSHIASSNANIITSGQFASTVGYGFSDQSSGLFDSGGKILLRMYGPRGVGIQNIYQAAVIGTQNDLSFVSSNVNPTSGNAVFNQIACEGIINQTGGANGITRSLYINPTLTAAADFRAIEVTAGKSIFQEVIANNVVRLKSYTVATLPTGVQGDTAYVTDATAPTYLGALTGGGSVVCPVFYNGTIWVSH